MSTAKKSVIILSLLAVIAAAGWWIQRQLTRPPKHNIALHTGVGEVMARETARVLGGKGRIVILALERDDQPELRTQISAFKHNLKQLGQFDVRNYELDAKDQAKYGVGSGLSARRYVRTANKNPQADAIVSFVGAPEFEEADFAELKTSPKLIAQSRSSDKLSKLFQKKFIEVAITSRFEYPSPAPEDPKTPQEWFDKRYQVVTAANAAHLPRPE